MIRNLRRVYFPLQGVLLVAWVFRITVFVSGEGWLETASVPGVPGTVVVGYFLALLAVTGWPTSRQDKGEYHDVESGE